MGPVGWSRTAALAIPLLCPFLIIVLPLPTPASAVMFTLRANSVLSKKPSYRAADRLDLKVDDVVVEGPALDQENEFCLYRLFNRQGKPSTPETAWVPCHSIDKLFSLP